MDLLEIDTLHNHTEVSQTRRNKIHCKQELLVQSLYTFYNERKDINDLLPLLSARPIKSEEDDKARTYTSDISLRMIDWFVTNYAKAYNTSYILNGHEFIVYREYKSQLKAYSKKLFDPFCRHDPIGLQLTNYPQIKTSVAKLNFFKWALDKNILEYIRNNHKDIGKDMNQSMKAAAKIRSTPTTGSSTSSNDSTLTTVSASSIATSTKSSTRRRLINSVNTTPIKTMQKHNVSSEMVFE